MTTTRLACLLLCLLLAAGCDPQGAGAPQEIDAFIETLRENGVDGTLVIRRPANPDIEYIAEYSIARYASTRIVSLFRFREGADVDAHLQEARRNDKLGGQARNGRFIMAATFYPPDAAAVEKIRTLFLAHAFE